MINSCQLWFIESYFSTYIRTIVASNGLFWFNLLQFFKMPGQNFYLSFWYSSQLIIRVCPGNLKYSVFNSPSKFGYLWCGDITFHWWHNFEVVTRIAFLSFLNKGYKFLQEWDYLVDLATLFIWRRNVTQTVSTQPVMNRQILVCNPHKINLIEHKKCFLQRDDHKWLLLAERA